MVLSFKTLWPARTSGVHIALCAFLACLITVLNASAQGAALSSRTKAADANGNGVIDRDEAVGPLLANFETIDALSYFPASQSTDLDDLVEL